MLHHVPSDSLEGSVTRENIYFLSMHDVPFVGPDTLSDRGDTVQCRSVLDFFKKIRIKF
jgi:hypothetical protein